MKKISTYLFVFHLLVLNNVFPQQWCTVGSTWVYDNSNPIFNTSKLKCSYVYDTIVNNETFNKIKTQSIVQDISGTHYNNSNIYTSLKNNVIYYDGNNFSLDNAIDTMLYFGDVGDKWHPKLHGGISEQQSYMEITELGSVILEGQTLNWRKISYTIYYFYGTSNQQIITGVDTIFDRIGLKKFGFQFYFGGDAYDGAIPLLICFSDNQINNSLCDFTTNVNENHLQNNNIKIYPNPVKEILNIENTFSKAENLKIHLTNVLGEELMSQNIDELNNFIDVGCLQSGIYILNILKDNKVIETKKIVKE